LTQFGDAFTKDIATIFQEKCQNCHRKDSMAGLAGGFAASPMRRNSHGSCCFLDS
jgi:hypothetical protein